MRVSHSGISGQPGCSTNKATARQLCTMHHRAQLNHQSHSSTAHTVYRPHNCLELTVYRSACTAGLRHTLCIALCYFPYVVHYLLLAVFTFYIVFCI